MKRRTAKKRAAVERKWFRKFYQLARGTHRWAIGRVELARYREREELLEYASKVVALVAKAAEWISNVAREAV